MELIKFIFSSFWIWLGTFLLIAVSGWAFNAALLGIRGKKCSGILE